MQSGSYLSSCVVRCLVHSCNKHYMCFTTSSFSLFFLFTVQSGFCMSTANPDIKRKLNLILSHLTFSKVIYPTPSLLKAKEVPGKQNRSKYKIHVVKRISFTQRRALLIFTKSNYSQFSSNFNWVDNLISRFAAD